MATHDMEGQTAMTKLEELELAKDNARAIAWRASEKVRQAERALRRANDKEDTAVDAHWDALTDLIKHKKGMT